MPSAGLPIESIFCQLDHTTAENRKIMTSQVAYLEDAVKCAMAYGMLAEWLESFVGAWNETHDVSQSIAAGLTEWDLM